MYILSTLVASAAAIKLQHDWCDCDLGCPHLPDDHCACPILQDVGIVPPPQYGTVHYATAQADVMGYAREETHPEVHLQTLESTNSCGLDLASDYECGGFGTFKTFDIGGCLTRVNTICQHHDLGQCTEHEGYHVSNKQQVTATKDVCVPPVTECLCDQAQDNALDSNWCCVDDGVCVDVCQVKEEEVHEPIVRPHTVIETETEAETEVDCECEEEVPAPPTDFEANENSMDMFGDNIINLDSFLSPD